MALVGNGTVNPAGGFVPSAPVAGATPVAEKGVDKAAKKAAAEKHREKVKAEKQELHAWALKLRDFLVKSGQLASLPLDEKTTLDRLCVPPSERVANSGPSFFTTIFGDKPAVGTVITLNDVINKTAKGIDTMNTMVKKWAAKGIEIKVDLNKQALLQTKYTIVAIGA